MGKNTIFDLEDTFHISSPLGNWSTQQISVLFDRAEFKSENKVEYIAIYFSITVAISDSNPIVTIHTNEESTDLNLTKVLSNGLAVGKNELSLRIKKSIYDAHYKTMGDSLRFYFTVDSLGVTCPRTDFVISVLDLNLGEISTKDNLYTVAFSCRSIGLKEVIVSLQQKIGEAYQVIPTLQKTVPLSSELTFSSISITTDAVNNRITLNGNTFALILKSGDITRKAEFKISSSKSCGEKYLPDIIGTKWTTKTDTYYGPLYSGKIPMSTFSGWDKLIAEEKLTEEYKKIIIYMSKNEGGKFDAIQAYDSAIITVGAMQKIADSNGFGELPDQLFEFGSSHPDLLKSLLTDCGWAIKKEKNPNADNALQHRLYYKDKTGKTLHSELRVGFNAKTVGVTKPVACFGPFINLCNNPDFQEKQIMDYVARINQSLNKTLANYSYKIKDYVHSALGIATVLDHSVNRPSHVSIYFNEALNQFFKANSVSKNPLDWGTNHAKYEKKILDIYGPLRGKVLKPTYVPMTDATKRYDNLKIAFP